jgi:uncharacterized protein YxeA
MKNLIVSILTVSSLVTLASPALADHNRHRDDQNCYIRYESVPITVKDELKSVTTMIVTKSQPMIL